MTGTAGEASIDDALLQYAGELLILVDLDGNVRRRIGAAPLGFGDTRQGRHFLDLVHPDDLPRALANFERAKAHPGIEKTTNVRARHVDGSWRMLEVTMWDRRHDLNGAVLRIRETARPSESAGEDDRFASLVDILPSGILAADTRSMVVFANTPAAELFDVSIDDLCQTGWQQQIDAEDLPRVLHAADEVLSDNVRSEATFRIAQTEGTRWVRATFVAVRTSGRRTGWLSLLSDDTERRRGEAELAHRATHDALTGLPNRALLEDRLRQAQARQRRHGQTLSLLFVDLDNLKNVNDEYGHTAGDELLIEVGRRLRSVVRAADTVARLGGDEFVVMCEDLNEAGAAELVPRIRDSVCVPTSFAGSLVPVAASIGMAHTRDPDEHAGALLARADEAMYHDKRHRARSGNVRL